MNRRQILKYASTLTGTAICAPLTSAMLAGCSKQEAPIEEVPVTTGPKPSYFDVDTFQLLSQIMDTILPKTETPSASEVGVPSLMDNMFNMVFDKKYKANFANKFTSLKNFLTEVGFQSASPVERLDIIKMLEATPTDKRTEAHWSYIDIKQQTVSYYLSTEEVAEKHLNYLPIPGQWKPCISLSETGGKKWAI